MDKESSVAFLWDESFLWGLMAYKSLKGINLPFNLIRAADVRDGALREYRLLFVPGGWASNKSSALGEGGIKEIQDFVRGGGSYLGFCGGAGLATGAKGGIGLLDVKRRPTRERVPSFSGPIELNLRNHHIWDDLKQEVDKKNPLFPSFDKGGIHNSSLLTPGSLSIFHAWWPSQFVVHDENIKILATYENALCEAFSSDLNVGDVEASGGWDKPEEIYGINLDPKRLKHEPAVIEGVYGKGRVILSLIHFDTPEDRGGEQVLRNLWVYLAGEKPGTGKKNMMRSRDDADPVGAIHELPLHKSCAELIALGERNFLWFWRNSMLLQWRRGVRGLEYNTLYILTREISEMLNIQNSVREEGPALHAVKEKLIPFVSQAKKLLLLERYALQKGHITYERCDDDEIQKMRAVLFSESKSHGGLFKELVDEIDTLLFALLKKCVPRR